MPLEPHQKMSLTLQLTVARYLDAECCDSDDVSAMNSRAAARGRLKGATEGVENFVSSSEELSSYLEKLADELVLIGTTEVGIAAAEKLLRDSARNVRNNDGDGPACSGAAISVSCACGVLEFAGLVELRVRGVLERFGVNVDSKPSITYVTALAGDTDRSLEPFCVNGQTDIGPSPRRVTVILKLKEFGARALVHLAYTFHHELICHAFQGALSSVRLPNAHPKCHWTEGWMDTVAYDLAGAWLSEDWPKSWLSLEGEDAVGELRNFHDHRYRELPGMERIDIWRRRIARDACRELPRSLLGSGIASSREEAFDMSNRFALTVNSHAEATCKRLKLLGTNLRIALLSLHRPEAAVLAAQAIYSFSDHNNFTLLEREIEAASAWQPS